MQHFWPLAICFQYTYDLQIVGPVFQYNAADTKMLAKLTHRYVKHEAISDVGTLNLVPHDLNLTYTASIHTQSIIFVGLNI